MFHVLIEHPVADVDQWKKAFDADPLGRVASGVTGFRVYRLANDESYVLVDLAFASRDEADAFVPRLHMMWERVQGSLIGEPSARVLEMVEEQ